MKDLRPKNNILGMQVHHDRKIWRLAFIEKLFEENFTPISTPLPINYILSLSVSHVNETKKMKLSQIQYASVVGSLMFVMILYKTRPCTSNGSGMSVHEKFEERALEYLLFF